MKPLIGKPCMLLDKVEFLEEIGVMEFSTNFTLISFFVC